MSDEETTALPQPPADTPWWSTPETPTPVVAPTPPQRPVIGLGIALILALVAGGMGALIGGTVNIVNSSSHIVSSRSIVERAPDSVAGLAARVSPSVVSISVKTSNGGDTGTGWFIDSNGYIVTNNHVVAAAVTDNGTISVTLTNKKSYPARIIGRDSAYDLAVLKINVTGAPALTLGNSDKVQVGDAVIAIGSPLGLAGTVTSGIISAKNRPVTAGSGTGESSFINALQTDAAINPGNSGGPLVDATGAVVGVNSAIASLGSSFTGESGSIGLGFAIPINQVKKTVDQLIKSGVATHPIMGLSLDSSFLGGGAKVADDPASILSGGPAEKAGIQPGDVITSFDGQVVNNSDELIVAVRSHNVGDTVAIKFERNGTSHEVKLTLIGKQ